MDIMAKDSGFRSTDAAVLLIMAVVAWSAGISMARSDEISLLSKMTICNLLPDLLLLHCESDNRDLHHMWLHGNGGSLYWDFYRRIWWGRTRWYCNFKWPAGGKWEYFVVWTEQNRDYSDLHCAWMVRPNEFWRLDQGTSKPKLVRLWLDVFPPPPVHP